MFWTLEDARKQPMSPAPGVISPARSLTAELVSEVPETSIENTMSRMKALPVPAGAVEVTHIPAYPGST